MGDRVALIVKYFPPIERISGIIGYVTELARGLAQTCDLHVIASGPQGAAEQHEHGYQIHRAGFPFPPRAGRVAAALDPGAVLVVSGVNDLRKAGPYFATMNAALPSRARRVFYQATNVAAPPGPAFVRAMRPYARIAAAGPAIDRALRARFAGRLAMVPPGVDVERLARVEPEPKRSGVRFGFVNHLNTVKGAGVAARAFAELGRRFGADVDLVIAGTGDLEREVSLPGIERRGFLAEAERLALIASCDVMLLPFRTEVSVLGISQTVLECMATGTVVAGSTVSPIADAIRHDQDGLLFTVEDDMMRHVLALAADPALRSRLAGSARARVRDSFSIESSVRAIAQLLEVER